MDVTIDYLSDSGLISIQSDDCNSDVWEAFIRFMMDAIDDYQLYDDQIRVFWRYFLPLRVQVANYFFSRNAKVNLTRSSTHLFQKVNERSYETAISTPPLSEDQIMKKLKEFGFKRNLKPYQLSNVSKIANMVGGATFSVPGAGKTTEALAYYCCNANNNTHLLVVAPKNAFIAWDEQITDCLPDSGFEMIRLIGGEKNIKILLGESPRFMIISYDQLRRVKPLIYKFMATHETIMFIDESHKIKNNKGGQTTESVLDLSYLPERKLLMSGTPMPQSVSDLIPQFKFLYPEKRVEESSVVSLFQPLFVRTTKQQLGLPVVDRVKIPIEMDDVQRNIYDLLKSEARRNICEILSDDSKGKLRRLGKCITKIMQFTSNPSLLATDLDYAFDNRIGSLLLQCNGPKIEYACKRARTLASENKKVIIWTTFVRNVELIAERLKDLGAQFIHGGVDAGSEDEENVREWKIKKFHEDPNCKVLVANPAAASEGISLHTVCQNAIYVDRSFNAAHYLQSEDRIHRLGLREDQIPKVEILTCRNSIDDVVFERLKNKVETMSKALNDPSLNIDVIPYDYEEDPDIEYLYVDNEDVRALKRYFLGGD